MDDYDWNADNQNGGADQQNQPQQQETQQQSGGGFDDYFGNPGEEQIPAASHTYGLDGTSNQSSPTQTQGFQSTGFNPAGGFGSDKPFGNEPIDPEEEERQRRLKKIEEERLQRIQERTAQERELKDERRQKANQDLQRWASDRNNTIKSRKELNHQLQEDALAARKSNQYKTPWEKVVANISIKDGDYPGKKDVKRMREAILNKRADAA